MLRPSSQAWEPVSEVGAISGCTLASDALRGVEKVPLRDVNREQAWLLAPSLDELLPLDHPARFVAEFVDALDRRGWKQIGVEIEGDPLGAPAYHPRALLSIWLYGFMTGMRSSRKLEAACRDQIPYLWLTGWQHPDHNTLWRFYKDHRQDMRQLFRRTVRTALSMDPVDLAVQAVDGTKVVAKRFVLSQLRCQGTGQVVGAAGSSHCRTGGPE